MPGEDPGEWEAFQRGIVASLAPVNALEAELAHQVGAGLWRLRRCAALEALRAEAAIAASRGQPDLASHHHEQVAEREADQARRLLEDERDRFPCYDRPSALARLGALPPGQPLPAAEVQFMVLEVHLAIEDSDVDPVDAGLLADLGLPSEGARSLWTCDGWTAAKARAVCAAVADEHGVVLDAVIEDAALTLRVFRTRGRAYFRKGETEVQVKEEVVEAVLVRRLLDAMGPDGQWSETLNR